MAKGKNRKARKHYPVIDVWRGNFPDTFALGEIAVRPDGTIVITGPDGIILAAQPGSGVYARRRPEPLTPEQEAEIRAAVDAAGEKTAAGDPDPALPARDRM